jgi:polyisoprenoid-binding protein YceI
MEKLMSLHHIILPKLSRRSFFTRLREMRTLFLRCSVKRKGSGNKGRSLTAGLLTMISAFTTGLAHSEWQLDNAASQLNFISTKASHIAETHTFDELSGTIDDAGKASLIIDLTSVNTGIGIRNERMQSMLFNVVEFPQAEIATAIDLQSVSKTGPTTLPVNATLSLAGATTTVAGEVLVSPSGANAVTVTTIVPIVVSASQLNLQPGIEALREIAGLPSISYSVPVTFSLTFRR